MSQDKYYTGAFKVRGATYDDNQHKRVIWCCKFYEPFNVVDVSDDKLRQKLWRECAKHFGKDLYCVWFKQTKRGAPIGIVYGTLDEDKKDELVEYALREEKSRNGR